jgi:molecular chaperone HscB
MIQCPSCARPQEPRLLCDACGAPLPTSSDLDLFTALGFPRKLTIDTSALESAYHELGRKIHPDRFASSSATTRALSLSATALLTRSYRTLRDPVSRGLYWLELHGQKLAENNKSVPPDLAEIVFEVQEQLSDLRDASGDAVAELRSEVEKRRAEISARIDELGEQLTRNFSEWDASPHSGENDNRALVTELKTILSNIAYLRTLLRDIERGLETLRAA